jgi:hypothetical protein
MSDDEIKKPKQHDSLAGAFVETAFTNEQVDQANEEEERLGVRDERCAFLGDVSGQFCDGRR